MDELWRGDGDHPERLEPVPPSRAQAHVAGVLQAVARVGPRDGGLRAFDRLEEVGLDERQGNAYPRAAIARALAAEPHVLILDEPAVLPAG